MPTTLFEEQLSGTTQQEQQPRTSLVESSLFPHASGTFKKDGIQYYEGKPLPKGVVLGKDGKPCKTCTSSAAWMSMMKGSSKAPRQLSSDSQGSISTTKAAGTGSFASMAGLSQSASSQQAQTTSKPQCPADVEELGRSTWTFLHTLPSQYPARASPSEQNTMHQFISLFAKLYPCWHCASDFQTWMTDPKNDPNPRVTKHLEGQERFGRWLCDAHNEVNVKLGKKKFDCNLWRGRWVDASLGGGDQRCLEE